MINYEVRKWGFCSLLYVSGSVFPKAFCVALPSAILAVLVHQAVNSWEVTLLDGSDVTAGVVGGYSAVLGFLINTRASKAYSRWWEGGTLLQQLRGEWFNAFSSLLAFCSSEPEKREEVEKFQQTMLRLMSMLYCAGLQQVSTDPAVPPEDFQVIDTTGLDFSTLAFLDEVNDKVEVVLQWIQRLIVENIKTGVLPIAPPILSRVFQEYSRGIVNLNNARKIAEFPFPFPLVQCITLMLCMHWLLIPLTCGTSIKSGWWAGLLTFVVVFSFWCIHFFSMELEMPFGRSTNHLPLQDMQVDMNQSLTTLLHRQAQNPPKFHLAGNKAPSTKTGYSFVSGGSLSPARTSEYPMRQCSETSKASCATGEFSASGLAEGLSQTPAGGQLDKELEPAAMHKALQQMVPEVPDAHLDQLLKLAHEHSLQAWDTSLPNHPNSMPPENSDTSAQQAASLRELGHRLSFLRSQHVVLTADGIIQRQISGVSRDGRDGKTGVKELQTSQSRDRMHVKKDIDDLHESWDKILQAICNGAPPGKPVDSIGG